MTTYKRLDSYEPKNEDHAIILDRDELLQVTLHKGDSLFAMHNASVMVNPESRSSPIQDSGSPCIVELRDWLFQVYPSRVSGTEELSGIEWRGDVHVDFKGQRIHYEKEIPVSWRSTSKPGWTEWKQAPSYHWRFQKVNGQFQKVKSPDFMTHNNEWLRWRAPTTNDIEQIGLN